MNEPTPQPGQAEHTPESYLLIEHGETGEPTVITIYETKSAREMATMFAIFGGVESVNGSHDEEIRKTLEALSDGRRLDFESDPSIEWIDAQCAFASAPALAARVKELEAVLKELSTSVEKKADIGKRRSLTVSPRMELALAVARAALLKGGVA